MAIETDSQQLLALRDAVLTITASLSLSETLQRIVAAAAHLAGARYAALAVPAEAGDELEAFVTHGLPDEVQARLAQLPRRHGVLGTVLRDGQTLRLRDVGQHPAASGFPTAHPLMTSFLGVPIKAAGRVLGELYLADKLGAAEFDDADQAHIELLAAQAAHAIQNARTHEAALAHERALERRNRELTAMNAVITATSSSLSLEHVLDEALCQVVAVYDAEAADIYLVDEASGDVTLALHRGPLPEPFLKVRRFRRGQGVVGQVVAGGQPRVLHDLSGESAFLRRQVVAAGFRSMVCLPLPAKGRVVGAVDLFSRQPDRFDTFDPELLSAICGQIGIAVDNARLHAQVRQLAVSQERQRIGMDLHDGVIQSIYASGLTLELALAELGDGNLAGAEAQVRGAIQALNNTIQDIRSYLLALRPRRFEGVDLVTGIERLLAEYRANTQMRVELLADRAAEGELAPDAREALYHIAQEALSNAARHSRATCLAVWLKAEGEWVVFSVRDNGCGMPAGKAGGHGLRNMRDRAHALGGEAEISSANGQGTDVLVRLPRRTGRP